MKKTVAALGTAAVLMTGAVACGNQGYGTTGYEQVWDNGHYVYVPDSYYRSHRSMYRDPMHPAHHYSSSYVTTHHIVITHQTTVHKSGTRTTVRRTIKTHRTRGFGFHR